MPRAGCVLWVPEQSGLRLSALSDLADERIRRIAIANPGHAPYGVAAREALRAAGLWDELGDKLIIAESVQQAFQYAASGNVEAALVAGSLAGAGGETVEVARRLYQPIEHVLGVVTSSDRAPGARAFAAFIGGPEARAILARHGFSLPSQEQ